MKIAILVWGSLKWNPGTLATTGEWFEDGAVLPIEFARISSGNRLTLVIKPNWDNVKTLYAVSAFDNLQEARADLQCRENTDDLHNIGFIDFTTNTQNARPNNTFVFDILRKWNEAKKFDAIIWSDFAPKFSVKRNGVPFTVENIKLFFEENSDEERASAEEYILKAPEQIVTRFRKELEKYFSERKSKK